MTYVVGSTRIDGWYLAAYRVVGVQITYAQWTDSRLIASEFSEGERKALKLPQGGCWIQAEHSLKFNNGSSITFGPTGGEVMNGPEWDEILFETDHESDEQEAKP